MHTLVLADEAHSQSLVSRVGRDGRTDGGGARNWETLSPLVTLLVVVDALDDTVSSLVEYQAGAVDVCDGEMAVRVHSHVDITEIGIIPLLRVRVELAGPDLVILVDI